MVANHEDKQFSFCVQKHRRKEKQKKKAFGEDTCKVLEELDHQGSRNGQGPRTSRVQSAGLRPEGQGARSRTAAQPWSPGSSYPAELCRARSRLYRSQILQENMRLKALGKIYTMHSFAQLCNHNFLSNFCQNVC